MPALGGDTRRLELGVAHRDVRVEAGTRGGDGVDGHEHVGAEAVLVAVGGDALGDGGEEVRVRRAEVGAARRGAVVAVAGRRRPGVEVLGRREGLADQLGADDHAVALDERAVGGVLPPDLGDRGDDERVGEPADHGEDDDGDQRRAELADERVHQETPSAEMTTSMSLMPTNGAMIPPTP